MKSVILAGGYGTRIRDVTNDIPKPMISVGGYPIIWHIMKGYTKFGIKNFIICLGYKGEIIKDYFVNYKNRQNDFTVNLVTQHISYHTNKVSDDWNITFAETGINAFTGCRVFRVKKYLDKENTFMLTYGDGVINVNIDEVLAFHRSHGKIITVTGARPSGRFGELEINGNQVVGFNEKPQATEGWISAGFFICNRKIFDYLNSDENLILEKEPIGSLVKDGEMMVFKHEGFWHPMDTPRDHQLLNRLWDQNEAPWKTWK